MAVRRAKKIPVEEVVEVDIDTKIEAEALLVISHIKNLHNLYDEKYTPTMDIQIHRMARIVNDILFLTIEYEAYMKGRKFSV